MKHLQKILSVLLALMLCAALIPAAAAEDDLSQEANLVFYVMGDAESRSCHIHMVPADGVKWKNYIAFRDYLNANPDAAGRYCVLKRELAGRYADDREAYTEGKAGLITRLLNEARTWKNAE